jgi:serine/threonine-protein kinase PknK
MATTRDGPSALLAAALAGRIDLEEPIGASGQARLYAGWDRLRGVEVVVKAYASDQRAMCEAEARALARLGDHPHVLTASVVGHGGGESGLSWIVTDRASGGSLAQRIGAPANDVIAWAVQLAEALAHTHANGVVHGDVTPSNVFLDSNGFVLLGDFGSAVLLGDATTDGRVTGHTPAFAAPERRGSTPPTPADDVYGLAATMMAVCGDSHELPGGPRRLLQRCLGASGSRPDALTLAHRLPR